MKKILATLALLLAVSPAALRAQGNLVRLNATTNGTTVTLSSMGGNVLLKDDDSQGAGAPDDGFPMHGIDYRITIVGDCGDDTRLTMAIEHLSVMCIDTVYIYDGPSVNSPLLKKFNYYYGGMQEGDRIFVSPTNTTNSLTVRFVTDSLTNPDRFNLPCVENHDGVGDGFRFEFHCDKPCEDMMPYIDSIFYRTRNGVIYDSALIRDVYTYDTVYVDPDNVSLGIDHIDTQSFWGANLCVGDGVIFKGHVVFSHNHGYYNPTDENTFFIWDMGNEGDTIQGVGVKQVEYADYQKTMCYDLSMSVIDAFGCSTGYSPGVKIRTAMNPIKTLFTLQDICSTDKRLVNMGYDGEGATLTLAEVESNLVVSKVYECITFIPDGCSCTNPNYFEAPVVFTEFPNSRKITSSKDVCSICINMEHTFMGDIYITLVCPTGREAMLKGGHSVQCSPQGLTNIETSGSAVADGSGTHLGWPTHNDGGQCSDPWNNPYGIGLDYCFSRDSAYTLITGQRANAVWTANNVRPTGSFYLGSSTSTITTTHPTYGVTTLPAPPPYVDANGVSHPFTTTPTLYGSSTRTPSDYEGKKDYYLPYTDFSELIGCPLNGTWKVRVYDTYNSDNGWIFNWSMDICNVSQDGDCKYDVGIDSLVWRPDPSPQYHDYDLGHYRGVVVERVTPTISYISTPDTAGVFPINVHVYDGFGCVWDTVTRITSHWTPEPNLGADTTLCGVDHMTLDASDRHTATENYSYVWAPFGESTPTIETQSNGTGDIIYVAEVKNHLTKLVCTARDTVVVKVRKQPMPNFVSDPFTFEGCDPLTISFENHSVDAQKYLWDFGDGITSELASPTHTYAEGIYTLKYYAISDDGCIDSVVADGGVAVYPKPTASFTWSPVYPSVLQPTVYLQNTTTPQTPNSKYAWEVQYDRDNPRSFETLHSRDVNYNFSSYGGSDISGNYNVHLIASTENLAPSGHTIVCSDTAANNILVINDFLQFPNVVTPNGDGVNDRFVIRNLVNGLAYPINSLDIYNKWGARVFHRENISNEDDFWDPSDLPDGTYFYRFSATGYNGNIEHNGAIEVIH